MLMRLLSVREQIQVRRDELRRRKELLELAKEHLHEEVDSEYEMAETIVQDRALYSTLRSRFGPTRTTLLTILSSIYPIELLSPPDLLYTILDVPLPIPLSSSDPAPPLTLPSHKDVNEDAIATSLGYAAQVVQLLAAYLGKALVYPVTCIGSRSLIRDNISAMVGPRMFPLYSKGVDTYRFEYGVFLLNKDIELLMADRDLRALDMRHTLPNLKNLLLTLTDGEGARLRHSPPASGSTTPTAAATEAATKKGRPFLAFSPLTDFLRGRYPSSSRISVKGSPDTSEDAEASEERHSTSSGQTSEPSSEQQSAGLDDRKISDLLTAEGRKPDPAPIANGAEEKVDEETHSPVHATPSLTPVR
ncbi:hypothetical protein DXG03_002705 [Asterophora parasitica]|uniref:Autophagy-related protein 14 n=1 Tax=Asterophora parasitica TaxID=117018 RepID=A0A9P7K9Q4_9AGAR|nr:hypothetical protein DXG03_002705 [Asterophora parasitica]